MTSNNSSIYKDKNAIIIFISQLVSCICDKMMSIGLIWYLTKTFSISVVPWFLTISFLPHLLAAAYSTKIINSLGPLRIVIYSEFFRGVILLAMAFGMHFFNWQDQVLLWSFFIMAFLVGVGSSLFNPAILSLPPRLVSAQKVVGLNALIDSSLSISTIMGATLAIFLLNFLDIKTVIIINAISFFWAGLLQMFLVPLKNEREQEEEVAYLSPISVLRKYPDIARLLLSFLMLNLVFTPILVMMPWYVEKIYLGDSSSLAMLEGAMGAGAFITALYLSFSHFKVHESQRIFMVSLLSFIFGSLFLSFAFSSLTWQGALAIFFIGVTTTFFNIQVLTHFQMAIEADEVPAIMTAVNIISAASIPLSLSFSGLIFPHVAIPNFAKVCGLSIIIISLILPKFLQGRLWKSA